MQILSANMQKLTISTDLINYISYDLLMLLLIIASLQQQGPECQNSSTDDLLKIHHCCYCKQPHYRMMDHLQSVHPNEPEVAKALTFDKNSQERKHLMNLLQTKGNVLHGTHVVQSSKQDLKSFRTFASDCSFDDSVYCIYCLGLFSKKSFATHLEQCKGKSIDSPEDSCGEIPPDAGHIPSTPTLTPLWSPEEIDANLEPSGFYCLNTTYESEQRNLYNEQESSSHQDVTCSVGQPDFSSPNKGVKNDGQTEGAKLQFKRSPEYEVRYDFKSDNFSNPSPGQESTDCKNEEISIPICDVDQERKTTENDVLRNPCDDFRPPHGNQTVSNDRVKAQTYGTRRKRKRPSRGQNEVNIMWHSELCSSGLPIIRFFIF